MTEPTRDQWLSLYRTADVFRLNHPWTRMTDESMYAVEDPESGEVGYAVVLGGAAMEFGLAVYVGAEGLDGVRRLMSGEVDPERFDSSTSIRTISMQFGSKDFLEERDRAVIRGLGLTHRDKNAWPWFRSLVPGYFPWYLDQDECRLLKLALIQGLEISIRVVVERLTLSSGLDEKPILTRCLRDGVWVDEWRDPPDLDAIQEEPPAPLDEIRLKRLREEKVRGTDRWQFDLFRLTAPVGSEVERPYFPEMLMGVNRQGLILCAELFEPLAPAPVLQDFLTGLLEETPRFPAEIQVESKSLLRKLRPLADSLKIPIRIANLNDFHLVRDEFMSLQNKLDE